ncbi:MAG TPA: NUDIX domain-containing protein [Patescibacteria group bacterium]|nr:NUDIX domain-containing protein [Patescibacteria group bacterium]
MVEAQFHFCPKCGGRVVGESCSKCGYVLYKNQAVTVSAAIVHDGKLLFARRKLDPYKGMLDLPGGYVEPTENVLDALARELHEELAVEVKSAKLAGIYGPDTYPFQGITGYNGCVVYLVDIGDQDPQWHDDVASIEWYPLGALPKPQDLAFASVRQFCATL